MRLYSMVPFRYAVLGLGLLSASANAASDGLSQEYCSSENTGSDYSAVYNIYQSNGACFDQCKSSYAFAVVQYQNCWCSNYIPADQQSTSSCDQNCPGYPDDKCGNEQDGLYGYIKLYNSPSGTEGAASTSTQASSTPASSASSEPVSTTSSPPPISSSEASSTETPTTSSASPSSPTTVVASITSTIVALITVSSTSSPSQSTSTTASTFRGPPGLTSQSSQTSTESSSTQQSTKPQAASTSSSQQQTSYVSQTIYQTVTQSQSPTTVVSYVTPTPASTSSSDPPTTFTSSSTSTYVAPTSSSTTIAVVAPVPATTEEPSSSMTPSMTPSPVTSVRVVTVSGNIVTQTVTSTPMVLPNSNSDTAPLQRKGLSGGAIAGIVIAALLSVAALLFGAYLLWRRRKRDDDAEGVDAATAAGRGPHNPRRNASVLSKTGLLSSARPASITEKDFDEPLYVNTGTGNNSVRHSMLFGPVGGAGEGVSPVSPLGSNHETGSQRRYSRPLVYDQRLNPSALFANQEANGSRVSIQDQQDYSRPLGIANPDIRPSFESRNSRA